MNTALPGTRWLSQPERIIRRRQEERLHSYLKNVVAPFSPYYRKLFERAGINGRSIRSLEDFAAVPFTSKTDLLNTPADPEKPRQFIITPEPGIIARRPGSLVNVLFHGSAGFRRKLEFEYRPVFLTSTTGRSADPIPFVFTRYDLQRLALAGRRLFETCGAEPEMRLLNMFPYAPHLAFWQTHYGAEAFGTLLVSTGGGKVLGTEGQLRFIRKVQPHVLIGMPTFVYHVLQQAAEEKIRCANLRRIVLGGEKVPEGMRLKLAALAGTIAERDVDVVATYGLTEARMAFAECPQATGDPTTGYHLYPDLAFFEVIDPVTGNVVGPEHRGELVYTPLDARGTVVVRYRTGDLIDGGLTYAPCPRCGRQGPRLVGNISRVAEMRELRLDKFKGTLVDFNQLERLLDDDVRLGAWQIELRKRGNDPFELDELVLHLSKRCSASDEELARTIRGQFMAVAELQPDRILFHAHDDIRALQGVGRELKENRIVDRRPAAHSPMGAPAGSTLEDAA